MSIAKDGKDIIDEAWKLDQKLMGINRRKKMRKRTQFNIHEGDLTRYGYSLSKSSRSRHIALNKAIRHYGLKKVLKKVAFLAGAARIPPAKKRKAKADLKWLMEKRKYQR